MTQDPHQALRRPGAGSHAPDGPSRTRVTLTAFGTLLVVLLELVLLRGVYHLPDTVHAEQRVVAETLGALSAPGLTQPAASAALTALAADLETLDGGEADRVLATARDRPDPVTARADVAALAERLVEREAGLARRATALFVLLLTVASFGWMFWFRRLVARHRRLEQQVTEQRARARSDQRLAGLVNSSADLVAVCDRQSRISYLTPSASTVLGIEPAELLGSMWSSLVDPEDAVAFLHQISSVGAERAELHVRLRHRDGRTLHAEGTITNLTGDEAVGGLVVTVRDVTERVQLEELLTRHAFDDPLTGLHNRRLLGDRLQHALAVRAEGGAQQLAVLFCDLDDFKEVNDRLGHGAGDQVLVEVGRRIAATMRAEDTCARLGGDEFAVLMERCSMPEAEAAAERLQKALSAELLVDGEALRVRASLGLAPGVPGESSSEEVLRNADVAMYLAKDRGKARVATYEPRLHTEALARLQLRSDLRAALDQADVREPGTLDAGGLFVQYQPTVDLQSGGIVGFEALVRWQHPDRGTLPPLLFVPLAEESGLIVRLGRWVLFEACRAIAGLHTDGLSPSIAINVAAQQLCCNGFTDDVLDALAASGLAARHLVLEITESVVLADIEQIVPRLAALRALGIRIAIDDFGTGYNSLAYLNMLPLDILKVDKSFVDSVTADSQAASVTAAIIAMSRTMQLETVAEGVEHADQARWLTGELCSHGQGYLWSRPVDLEEAGRLLRESPAVSSLLAG